MTAEAWYQAALAATTSHADTHPCLTDRLRAIGAQTVAPPSRGHSAEQSLGAQQVPLQAAMDVQWREQVAVAWKKLYEDTLKNRSRLSELRSQST
jgi:hypothetical protein